MHPEIIPVNGEVCEVSEQTMMLFSGIFLQDDFLKDMSICCFQDGNKVYIRYLPENAYAYFFPHDIKQCLIFFAGLFYIKNENNISYSYNVLLTALNLSFEKKEYYELFRKINWQGSDKGLKYFLTMNEFSGLLRNKVLEKKISLNDAYEFHCYFKNFYDAFLEKLPENLSFSNAGKIIRYATEYAKKNIMTSMDIAGLEFDKCNITDFFFKLRYPLYSEIQTKFNSFLKKMKLPDNVKIIYDESYESGNYKLEINFSDLGSLHEKIKQIEKNIEKIKNETDLFDQSNLFEKNKL